VNEEDIVETVVPAVRIEEGIPDDGLADSRQGCFHVHGRDERARTP
jgi:hypothetical protein